jgi:hypothetical protein
MGVFIADYLITGLGVAFDGDLIGHSATGAKYSSLHSKHIGRHSFQLIDGWIFPKNIIPNRGLHHEIQHGCGRAGYRVGPEVCDHGR